MCENEIERKLIVIPRYSNTRVETLYGPPASVLNCKFKIHYNCDICCREFILGGASRAKIKDCGMHKYYKKCFNCNKWIECDLNEILNPSKIKYCDKSCSISGNKLPGLCTICGKFNMERDQNSRGKTTCDCSKNAFKDLRKNLENTVAKISLNGPQETKEVMSIPRYSNTRIETLFGPPVSVLDCKFQIHYDCDLCGREFITGGAIRNSVVKDCKMHVYYKKCSYCGKWVKTSLGEILDPSGKLYCNKQCSVRGNMLAGFCSKCSKFNTKRDQNARGKDLCSCSHDFMMKHNGSQAMRKQARKALTDFYKTQEGKDFLLKHNQSEKMRKQAVELGKIAGPINARKLNERNVYLCEVCNKETQHNGFGTCLDCNPQSRTWENNLKPGNCTKCGVYSEKRSCAGMCRNCMVARLKEINEKRSRIFKANISKFPLQKTDLKNKRLVFKSKQSRVKRVKEMIEQGVSVQGQVLPPSNNYYTEFGYICGSIGLTGVYKGDGVRYALTAGKSVNLQREINFFVYNITHPDEMPPYGTIDPNTGKIDSDYGRWHTIANEYEDFEIVLLTDKDGVTEEQALDFEFLWAIENEAYYHYSGNKIKLEGTHGYWLP